MKKKLSDLYSSGSPLLGQLIFGEQAGYPVFYGQYADILDREFVRAYGDYCYVNHSVMNDNELLTAFQRDVYSFLVTNDYKYSRLWETTRLTYNPIENYSMTEEIKVEYNGEETTGNKRTGNVTNELIKTGEESTVREYTGEENNINMRSGNTVEELKKTGSESATRSMAGKEKATDTYNGSESTENVIGAITSTNTNSVSADDSSGYSPNEQTQNVAESHTDTSTRTYDGRSNVKELEFTDRQDVDTTTFTDRKDTNTTTYNDVSDSNTKSFTDRQDVDTTSFNNRQDINTTTFNDVIDQSTKSFTGRNDMTTHTRSGNIGVTTSQQMLQSERDVAMFSFWNTLFNDIATEILFFYDTDSWGCD